MRPAYFSEAVITFHDLYFPTWQHPKIHSKCISRSDVHSVHLKTFDVTCKKNLGTSDTLYWPEKNIVKEGGDPHNALLRLWFCLSAPLQASANEGRPQHPPPCRFTGAFACIFGEAEFQLILSVLLQLLQVTKTCQKDTSLLTMSVFSVCFTLLTTNYI